MKKIGLALEGGGLKGGYQVGSYYAFKKCHIKISGYVGTSIGSFNACLLASGQAKDLLELWQNLEPGKLLDINQEFADYINGKQKMIKALQGLNSTVLKTIKQKGISTDKLRKLAEDLINKESLYNNKKDFGLITVRLHNFEPIYEIYIDGGFYDNCPIKLLIDKNYDTIYEIRINGIGRNRNVAKKNSKVITIRPSRNICSILELNQEKIKENILLGYYDTLRVLKKYDGYKYTFSKISNIFIKVITRKISKRYMSRIRNFFKAKSNKETVIKAIEYAMNYFKISPYHVYNFGLELKHIQNNYLKNYKTKNLIFNFLKKLRIF